MVMGTTLDSVAEAIFFFIPRYFSLTDGLFLNYLHTCALNICVCVCVRHFAPKRLLGSRSNNDGARQQVRSRNIFVCSNKTTTIYRVLTSPDRHKRDDVTPQVA